jgi:hypothetical protein
MTGNGEAEEDASTVETDGPATRLFDRLEQSIVGFCFTDFSFVTGSDGTTAFIFWVVGEFSFFALDWWEEELALSLTSCRFDGSPTVAFRPDFLADTTRRLSFFSLVEFRSVASVFT